MYRQYFRSTLHEYAEKGSMNPFNWTLVSASNPKTTPHEETKTKVSHEAGVNTVPQHPNRSSKETQTQISTRTDAATQSTVTSLNGDEIQSLIRSVSRLQTHVESARDNFDAKMKDWRNRNKKGVQSMKRLELCVQSTADRLDTLADQFAVLAAQVTHSTTNTVVSSRSPAPYIPGALKSIHSRSRHSRSPSRSLSHIYIGMKIKALFLNNQWKSAVVTRVSRNRSSGAVESVDAYFTHDSELTLSVSGKHLYTHLMVPAR